jgi:hypothetical protein
MVKCRNPNGQKSRLDSIIMDRLSSYSILPKLLPPIDISFELVRMASSMVVDVSPYSILDIELICFFERYC